MPTRRTEAGGRAGRLTQAIPTGADVAPARSPRRGDILSQRDSTADARALASLTRFERAGRCPRRADLAAVTSRRRSPKGRVVGHGELRPARPARTTVWLTRSPAWARRLRQAHDHEQLAASPASPVTAQKIVDWRRRRRPARRSTRSIKSDGIEKGSPSSSSRPHVPVSQRPGRGAEALVCA